jgi:TPR repeat protein
MLRLALLAVLVLPTLPVLADVRIHGDTDAVSMPYVDWELRFPPQGWELSQQRQAGDGRQFYYMFSNLRRRLVVSFFLEPAYKCETGDACRANFRKNPGAGYVNLKENRTLTRGEFSVLEFSTSVESFEQLHWSAHMVRDGVWIDMHISGVTRLVKDYAALQAFAEEISVAQKTACPECLKLKGLSRQDSTVLFSKARAGDAKSWDRLQELAKSGDAEAQFIVARMYSWGATFLKQDEHESVTWCQKAAEQGHPDAQSNLAYFHVSGRGVDKKDPQAALQWWTKAAEQGFAPAQFSVGLLYGTDLKDDAKSFEWMKKAANSGLANAQLNLGLMYVRGVGPARDLGLALDWYQKAAIQGNEQAMVNMAALYGLSGRKDFVDAALVILNEPVLAVNDRAKGLKAKICAENPDACKDRRNSPVPTAPPVAK